MGSQGQTILIYGGTGALGSLIALACAREGHKTLVVVRPATRSSKGDLCNRLEADGVGLVEGDFSGSPQVLIWPALGCWLSAGACRSGFS